MGEWLISIAAVVALSVLLDIIVPEGETNKYIKGIFALITIFVIISPVTKLLDNEFTIEGIFDSENSTTIDQSFVDYTNNDINELTNTALEKVLEDNGYINVTISVYLDYESNIDYVIVDLKNLSIQKDVAHINIINDIKSIVCTYLDIDEERVTIHGNYTG